MSRIPTYFLAPNFTLTDASNSPWHPYLGNIIGDPLNPTTRLLSKASSVPNNIVTVPEVDVSYSQTQGRSLSASVFANFLEVASANVGGSRAKELSSTYSADGLETRYFEPSDEEVLARIEASPKVRAAMNAGLFGKTPVYMITGIKVAKGFAVESGRKTQTGANVGGAAPVAAAAGLTLGADVGGELRNERSSSSRTADGVDIVFAYQVHIIAEKGWREKSKRIESEVYVSKQAFLGQGGNAEGEIMEASALTMEDLKSEELDLNDATKQIKLTEESGETCVCVISTSEMK